MKGAFAWRIPDSLLGDNTKAAILSQLQDEGVEFTPEHFDIEKFCRVTEDMLGPAADTIIKEVVDEFCKQ